MHNEIRISTFELSIIAKVIEGTFDISQEPNFSTEKFFNLCKKFVFFMHDGQMNIFHAAYTLNATNKQTLNNFLKKFFKIIKNKQDTIKLDELCCLGDYVVKILKDSFLFNFDDVKEEISNNIKDKMQDIFLKILEQKEPYNMSELKILPYSANLLMNTLDRLNGERYSNFDDKKNDIVKILDKLFEKIKTETNPERISSFLASINSLFCIG